ncbi:MAG: class I SAM-dependent methyltransferase [Piscirickettsiaceae bacterium]|nr:class I SAM-dependent methyltransferase [Piscirickettsiaceae bacterium]
MPNNISISTDSAELEQKAIELANKLNTSFASLKPQQIQLVLTQQHIEIRAPDLGNPIFIDFEQGKNAHRRQFGGGRGQPLAKAIGLKKGATPTIIDATAGFGRDAFVLANLGCQITLIERNPFIATLLEDALNRAQNSPEISDVIKQMSLINHDAIAYLNQHRADVIYMDPMYPSREKSALVKKDMRLLHQLAGADTDSEQLLTSARKSAIKRVVVKRPKSAPFVGEQKPSTSIESKNTRYDVYLTNESLSHPTKDPTLLS